MRLSADHNERSERLVQGGGEYSLKIQFCRRTLFSATSYHTMGLERNILPQRENNDVCGQRVSIECELE
jgi:hypothetical protein